MRPRYKGIGHHQQKFKDIIDRIDALVGEPLSQWTQDRQRKLERLHALRIAQQVEMMAELRL